MKSGKHQMIITMAGIGMRFRKAGYDKPKYMIEVKGRTLFEWAMESLRNWFSTSKFHFIVLEQDNASAFIEQTSKKTGISDVNIIQIAKQTDGQATSALFVENFIENPDSSMSIYNIDTFVEPVGLPCTKPSCDGWIPCFPGAGDGWSFVGLDSEGFATEVREKKRISPHATIGFYWFSSWKLYRQVYNEYYSNTANLEKNEKYVAPLYNKLISDGRKVRIHEIPIKLVHALGTPEEVNLFRESDWSAE
ncbi:MAG: glycosyltransferase family 2 protein [Candidatus Riflebacteria bacterium]|nr:glycosyltransferase family 2 protein [Candidatus Riflebacteria bacterium]